MRPTRKRIIVDGVDFGQLVRFPMIFRAVTSAMQPPRILIALACIMLLAAGGRSWDAIAGAREIDSPSITGDVTTTIERAAYDHAVMMKATAFEHIARGFVTLDVDRMLFGGRMLAGMPGRMWTYHPVFVVIFGLYALLLCSVFGGALCRMSACQNAQQERLRIGDAFRFVRESVFSLVAAPLLPLVSIAIVGVVLMIPGLLMAIPGLEVIGSLLYGLALVLGLLLALLIIGYAIGFPMLIPAVACERCTASDAMQRAYAYVIQRPLHVIGYFAVAMIGLIVGFGIVSLVATVTLQVTALFYGLFAPEDSVMRFAGDATFLQVSRPDAVPSAEMTASLWFIRFWEGLVQAIVIAYLGGYFFAASTISYLLVRRSCDGQDVDEIWQPGQTPGSLAPRPTMSVVRTEDAA